VGQVLDVFESQLPSLQERRTAAGSSAQGVQAGFGLYLAAAALGQLERDTEARARLVHAVKRSPWPVWTANAFPFGGFHGRRVKEAAFLPDWSDPQRRDFTLASARFLASCMRPGETGSVSTCPLGYGSSARNSEASLRHLEDCAAGLEAIEQSTGVRLCLAIEPEPDGGFERVPDLAEWLQAKFAHPLLGICWDLCHSAVVGESTQEVLDALLLTGTPLGKIQVSAALRTGPGFGERAQALLQAISTDRYFHQVRGRGGAAWPDLPEALLDPNFAPGSSADDYRVHCHVPLHVAEFAPGLAGTEWRDAAALAAQAGYTDFEIETYTLPILPDDLLGSRGAGGEEPEQAKLNRIFDVLAAEIDAAEREILLDRGASLS